MARKKDRHKPRIFLLVGAIILLLSLGFLYFRSVKSIDAAWFNDLWSYRKRIDITNGSGSNLSNFQVSFTLDTASLITAGKMKADCSDIRIIDQTGSAVNYWIEENNPGCNNSATKIWAKVASLPITGAPIYVYYGNSSAKPTQDGNKVFDFFDDFNGTSLNTNKWKQYSGSLSLLNGELIATENANLVIGKLIAISAPTGNNYAMRARLKAVVGTNGDERIGVSVKSNTTDGYGYNYVLHNFTALNEISFLDDSIAWNTRSVSWTKNTYYTMEMYHDGTYVQGRYNDGSFVSQAWSGRTGYPAINFGSVKDTTSTWDFALVRKVASSDPSTSIATEETGGGPSAWWKFDEGQGNTANDSSGRSNTGTLMNSPTWTAESQCVVGKCIKFDGTSSYIKSTNVVPLASTATFVAWIKTAQTDGAIMGNYNQSVAAGPYFRVQYGKLSFHNGTGNTTSGNTTINDNKWHHVAAVVTGSAMTLFVDGIQDVTGPGSLIVNNSDVFYVGSVLLNRTPGSFFNGYIDDAKVYRYARSYVQIKEDYAAGKAAQSTKQGSEATFGSSSFGKSLSDGLVGYWKMDETSWGSVVDSSGNGNNGTAVNGATVGTGKFGNGGSFTAASSQDVSVPTSTSISPSTGITVAMWVNASGDSEILQKVGGYGAKINTGKFTFYRWGGPESHYSTTTITGGWNFLVGTYDGKIHKTYVNGKLEASQADVSSIPTGGSYLYIGGNGSGSYMNGSLDELHIYNRALSPTEVKALYTYAPGPVGYWKMDEGSGGTAYDSSGNGNNGTWGGTGNHWGVGKMGRATQFNGSNDYLSIGYNSSINTYKDKLSIGLWFKLNQLGVYQAFMGGYNSYYFRVTNGNVLHGYLWGPNVGVTGSTVLQTNKWYYANLIYDGATVKLFLNGQLDGSAAATGNVNGQTFAFNFGADNGPGSFFNGSIDEVRIYNYARTQEQILQDMGANSPVAPRPGKPLAWYKFDEAAGSTANNSGFGGSPLNGVLPTGTASPTWTSLGKVNKALSFNGVGTYLTVPNNTNISALPKMSLSAWIKSSRSGSGQDTIFSKQGSGEYYLNAYAGPGGQNGRFYINQTLLNFTYSYTPNTWYYIVATYDSSITTMTVYVNGVQAATTTSAPSSMTGNSTNLYIGTDPNSISGAYTVNGTLDDVKIYNYALSADEVKQDYNAGASVKVGKSTQTISGTTTNLNYCIPGDTSPCSPPVAEWNFEEGKGATAYDTSGNGNNGTLTNGPTWTTGKVGKGVSFDGISSYSVINSLSPTSSVPVSVFGWVYPTLNTTTAQCLISRSPNGWAPVYMFCPYVPTSGDALNTNTNGKLGIYMQSTQIYYDSEWIYSDVTVPLNTWSYIGFIYDGSAFKLYYNGRETGKTLVCENPGCTENTNYLSSSSYQKYYIGAGRGFATDNPYMFFKGSIDQDRIYNYVRSPAQIAYDYNKGAPVGWWKLDECQGNIAHDSSINRNDGSITIGASGTQTSVGTCNTAGTAWGNGAGGKINASLNFDGVDDYINVGTASIFNFGTNSFTISQWVKNPTGGNPSRSISKMGDTANSSPGWYLQVQAGYFGWGAGDGTNTWIKTGVSYSYNTDAWYNIVSIFNRNTKLFDAYINGQKVTSVDISSLTGAFDSANPLFIGKRNNGTPNYYQGQIDDVRIYNYALTSTQVKTLYNGGAMSFK